MQQRKPPHKGRRRRGRTRGADPRRSRRPCAASSLTLTRASGVDQGPLPDRRHPVNTGQVRGEDEKLRRPFSQPQHRPSRVIQPLHHRHAVPATTQQPPAPPASASRATASTARPGSPPSDPAAPVSRRQARLGAGVPPVVFIFCSRSRGCGDRDPLMRVLLVFCLFPQGRSNKGKRSRGKKNLIPKESISNMAIPYTIGSRVDSVYMLSLFSKRITSQVVDNPQIPTENPMSTLFSRSSNLNCRLIDRKVAQSSVHANKKNIAIYNSTW